jgi:HlyD family secretion protein
MVDQERKDDNKDLRNKIASWSPELKAGSVPGELPHAGEGMDRKLKKRRFPPRRIAAIGFVTMFIGAILYQIFFGDHTAKLNVQKERITISMVKQGLFQEFIPARGTVLPILTIYLDALEGGRVEEIFLEGGTMVEQGDPILKLSNSELELRVMTQEASLFEQINSMENTRILLETQAINRQQNLINIEHEIQRAKREFDKNEELMKRELISRKLFEESRDDHKFALKRYKFMMQTVRQDSLYRQGQVAQLEASVRKLQLNLEAVKRNLDNLVLKAPVRGQLTSLNADIGELKGKGQRLGQIDVLDGYKLRAQIDEFYIQRISGGQEASYEYSDQVYKLNIKKVYPEVLNGQFEVDLEFSSGTPHDIRRGQTLHIRLALGDLTEAMLLPRGGFYQVTGGNWVFLVDPSESEAIRRPVRIGRQNPEYFEVLEGLENGERVVTSSYDNYEEIEKLILK